jgi:hypothetical protein
MAIARKPGTTGDQLFWSDFGQTCALVKVDESYRWQNGQSSAPDGRCSGGTWSRPICSMYAGHSSDAKTTSSAMMRRNDASRQSWWDAPR